MEEEPGISRLQPGGPSALVGPRQPRVGGESQKVFFAGFHSGVAQHVHLTDPAKLMDTIRPKFHEKSMIFMKIDKKSIYFAGTRRTESN